jgi:hypothetical protein
VSSHEIGHALGLLHNFGSSSTVPVEKLRDKKWLAVNGHTPSIMDYARFNYVAQPEDSIPVSGIFPRIGDYDNWAIEWGYRIFMDTLSGDSEAAILNKLTIGMLKNRRLWFGAENNPEDPRSQNEDLGDDAMKAGAYGIKNLKRIVPHLAEWTSIPNENYDHLQEMYSEVLSQFMRYMGHAAKNIGGTYETRKTSDQPGDVYEYVPAATQKRALRFISDNLFTTPYWLIDKNIYFKFGSNPISNIGSRQDAILSSLLSTARLDKLVNGGFSRSSPAYSLSAYMADLQNEIWREVHAGKPIDVYRRNLQKSFLEKTGVLIEPAAAGNVFTLAKNTVATNDVISVVKYDLKQLEKKIAACLPTVTDTMTMMHLQDCLDRIGRLLKPKS